MNSLWLHEFLLKTVFLDICLLRQMNTSTKLGVPAE